MEPIITKEFALNNANTFKAILIAGPQSKYIRIFLMIIGIYISYTYINVVIDIINLYINGGIDMLEWRHYFILLVPVIFYLTFKLTFGQMFMKSKAFAILSKNRTITFSDDSIKIDVEGGARSELKMSIASNVKYKFKNYIISLEGMGAITVPSSAFQSEEDEQRFRELFNFKD